MSSHPGRPELKEEPKWQPEQLLFLPRCFLRWGVSPNILFDQWKVHLFQFESNLQLIGTSKAWCFWMKMDEDVEQVKHWPLTTSPSEDVPVTVRVFWNRRLESACHETPPYQISLKRLQQGKRALQLSCWMSGVKEASLSALFGFAVPLVRLLVSYHWAWKPWEAHSAQVGKHMDARALLMVCLSFSHERKSQRMSKGFPPWRYMVLFVGKVCWSWLFRFIQRVGH